MSKAKKSKFTESTCVKGDKFKMEADKKRNGFDWFGMKKQVNNEDAAELYVRAAAQYKISKLWDLAGLCYSLAADCNMIADNDIEAKSNWRESGKCYRHGNYKKAIESYKNAIQMNLDNDRFGQAAKLEEEIGDMLADDEHFKEAIESYEKSADYYDADNDEVNRNKRLLKVAKMSANVEEYKKAIKIYKDTAKHSADNQLLRWKVKEYCFHAMILELCMKCKQKLEGGKVDWDKVSDTHESYKNISNLYDGQRECKLIDQIIESCSDLNMQLFKDSVAYYDKICKLDPWLTKLLLKIENFISKSQHLGFNPDDDDGDEKESENNNKKKNINLIKKPITNNNNNNNNNEVKPPNVDEDFGGAPDADLL